MQHPSCVQRPFTFLPSVRKTISPPFHSFDNVFQHVLFHSPSFAAYFRPLCSATIHFLHCGFRPNPSLCFSLPRLSFVPSLCRVNLPSRIHTTTTHKQASKHFNQQSVTKDNRLEEQSPCRRHCLSVVSNVRSRSRVRFATIELESYVGVVVTANGLTDLLVRARVRGMMTDRRECRVTRR